MFRARQGRFRVFPLMKQGITGNLERFSGQCQEIITGQVYIKGTTEGVCDRLG